MIRHLKTLPSSDEAEAIQVDFEVGLVSDDSEQDADAESFVTLKRSHFNLSLRANGKAELYFHCYFWSNYFESVAKKQGVEAEAAFADLP